MLLARLRALAQMVNSPLIFIIDDDQSVRESVQSLVRSAGYRAEAFASAEEFLHSCRPGTADCLILDVCLPGTSGLDLQRQLISSGSRIPIVFITAQSSYEARLQAMNDGAVEFLFKPFSEEALLDALHAALKV
jgi:FixJ family two-component response regulator